MNIITEEQLKLCKVAHIPSFDETTNHIIIPKTNGGVRSDYEIGHSYLIHLEHYIISPPEGFTLHANWNNNIVPVDEYMQVSIVNEMGKMLQVNGKGYNPITMEFTGSNWNGWLPKKAVKLLERL